MVLAEIAFMRPFKPVSGFGLDVAIADLDKWLFRFMIHLLKQYRLQIPPFKDFNL